MKENTLNISQELAVRKPWRKQYKEMEAKYERMWLLNPEQFNPLRNCMHRERLERTWQLMHKHSAIINKKIVDLGCGAGVFSRRLHEAGAHLQSVDIAHNALKEFQKQGSAGIELIQDAMPQTSLRDYSYDSVVCMELIAELPPTDYRLFFAELTRLVKPDGVVICSSEIDIYSEGAVEKLRELAQTEFTIIEEVFSYHRLHIQWKHFLAFPSEVIDAWRSPIVKETKISARKGWNRLWFKVNSSSFLIWLWFLGSPVANFFLSRLKNSRWMLLKMEKWSRFFWDADGISNYLFIAKRRPLPALAPENIPLEKPKRKEIWE
jgi:2-polyprenyl-3-methyl-5-hydroxy-6-metoxy-1,4-benzoquinol methylase